MLPGLEAAVDRLVKRGYRDAMWGAAQADPTKPRFARVPAGKEPCQFCLMLASRGFVYTSASAAGDHNQYHSHCACVPVASWESSPLLEGYDPDALYRQYELRSTVPPLLLGGAADWPQWLQPVSLERWRHIVDDHGPDSTTPGKSKFTPDMNIGQAIFDTIVDGDPGGQGMSRWRPDDVASRTRQLPIDGKVVTVKLAYNRDSKDWFVTTAFPDDSR